MVKSIKEYLRWKLYKGLYKPGHFYSTIPSLTEVTQNRNNIFNENAPGAIDLQIEKQSSLLKEIQPFQNDFQWPHEQSAKYRYYSQNSFFNTTDARLLFGIIRRYSPSKIIEIGSGFSSALMMDTNELFFNNSLDITFIEPYPDRLKGLFRKGDTSTARYHLLEQPIQSVSTDIFSALGENDILFVDSSHVSKVGSDLNHILFNIIPTLNKGVIIHFHDIMYPFEYPESWIMQGIYWNEAYLLRSFLMYNSTFEIVLMNNYWHNKNVPGIVSLDSGGGLWLRKIR